MSCVDLCGRSTAGWWRLSTHCIVSCLSATLVFTSLTFCLLRFQGGKTLGIVKQNFIKAEHANLKCYILPVYSNFLKQCFSTCWQNLVVQTADIDAGVEMCCARALLLNMLTLESIGFASEEEGIVLHTIDREVYNNVGGKELVSAHLMTATAAQSLTMAAGSKLTMAITSTMASATSTTMTAIKTKQTIAKMKVVQEALVKNLSNVSLERPSTDILQPINLPAPLSPVPSLPTGLPPPPGSPPLHQQPSPQLSPTVSRPSSPQLLPIVSRLSSPWCSHSPTISRLLSPRCSPMGSRPSSPQLLPAVSRVGSPQSLKIPSRPAMPDESLDATRFAMHAGAGAASAAENVRPMGMGAAWGNTWRMLRLHHWALQRERRWVLSVVAMTMLEKAVLQKVCVLWRIFDARWDWNTSSL